MGTGIIYVVMSSFISRFLSDLHNPCWPGTGTNESLLLTSLLPQVPLNLGYTGGAAHPGHLYQHSLPGLSQVHTKVRQLEPLFSAEFPDGRRCPRSVSLIIRGYHHRVSVGVGDTLAR